MWRISMWISGIVVCVLVASSAMAAEELHDIRDYGAKPDGKTLCTSSIQQAIDACSRAGGGTVYLPPGIFLSGTIYFKSGVTLKIAAGCTLLGSTNLKDYPPTVQEFRSYTDNYTDKSLIYGENVENIAITGRGTVDGEMSPSKTLPSRTRRCGCSIIWPATMCA